MANNKKIEKSDALTVFLHWGLVVTLTFSLLTGLRISADSQSPVLAHALDAILLQGNVMLWHVWAASALFLIAVLYVIYLIRARLKARVALDAYRIRSIASSDRETRWKALNVIVYWLAFVLILMAAITGSVLYFLPGVLPHETVITVHLYIAWSLLAYVVLHVISQLMYGSARQLLKILNPRWGYGQAAAATSVIALLVGGGVYALDLLTVNQLQVAEVSEAPILDGIPGDAVWRQAEAVEIHTNRGENNPGGEVTVRVRMVHDNENLYALFEWDDSTRSQKHLPLQKTEDGWKVVQREYYKQDEDHYYEDKFGVMFADHPSIAGAGTSHLGPKPIDGKPGAAGGRGLHYTTDNSIVDVWHWKSVRTGQPVMRQIDDNYFGPPMEVNPKKKRYTGGYTQDPNTGGGYKANWEEFSVDVIRPLRLPKDPALLNRLGRVDLDPNVSDKGEFWMSMEETVAYSEALDTYPVGTIMPSVLIKGPRLGDRGDVTAVSHWENGVWRMETRRKLVTDSKYDIAFKVADPVYMWVAVFDHTQTRHSQHLHPVKLVME